ncbi:MAG TPA: ABC transporter substrate-binding protein, partial [Gammaproteobacteria bacterium]|nr:ABC transporter substrate-binding protein [Gammaproteobacteria bacterium]
AARLALEKFGAPLDGDKLRQGFEMVKDYDAQGLMPPVTFSTKDHQGGGFGRVSQWNGKAWEPVSDWHNAYQDIVWEEIRKGAAEFKKGR